MSDDKPDKKDLAAAKLKTAQADAAIKTMKARRLKGELVERREVDETIGALIRAVREAADAAPRLIPAHMSGDERRAVSAAVTATMERMLASIAASVKALP